MATVSMLADEDLSPEAQAVFDDIRAVRGSDFVNNIWRALAHDPPLLKRTWEQVKAVMASPGELDPVTREMIYRGLDRQWLFLLRAQSHRRGAGQGHDGCSVCRIAGNHHAGSLDQCDCDGAAGAGRSRVRGPGVNGVRGPGPAHKTFPSPRRPPDQRGR